MSLINIIEHELGKLQIELKKKKISIGIKDYKDILEDGTYISTVATFDLFQNYGNISDYPAGTARMPPKTFSISVDRGSSRRTVRKQIRSQIAKVLLE